MGKAIRLVLRLLATTAARCWWLVASPIAVTLILIAIPQGREFHSSDLTLASLLAVIVVSPLFCALLGVVATWLMWPQRPMNVSRVIPAAGSFGAGLAMFTGPACVGAIIGSWIPNSALPSFVQAIGLVCMGFVFKIVQAGNAKQDWRTNAVHVALAGFALVPILLGWHWLAVVASIVAYLVAHVHAAWRDSTPYLWSRRKAVRQVQLLIRFITAPIVVGLVLVMGWNNAVDPVLSLGATVGPLATLLIAMTFWIALCFAPVWLGDVAQHLWSRRQGARNAGDDGASWGFRLLAAAGIAVGAALALGSIAQAPVSELTNEVALASKPAGTVEDHLKEHIAWLASHGTDNGPVPVVIVAAEGGGVRAAYWTASVLAALSERYKGFGPSVVALSGVSGGSVGVTLYGALMQTRLDRMPCRENCPKDRRAIAQLIAGSDFFSPSLLSLLVSEPIRDVHLTSDRSNRAAALERALASNYHNVVGQEEMSAGFCALQPSRSALILPGLTDAKSGKRVVLTCHDRATTSIDPTEPIWLQAGWRLSASAAAFLSARFPVVSPTGLLKVGDREFRFVDGGYSDNTGAGTAVEVLTMVRAAAKDLSLEGRIRPVVLVLNTAAGSSADKQNLWDRGLMGLLSDPLSTLDAVRARNAEDYRRWLNSSAGSAAHKVETVEWTLPNDRANPFPLGWLLSQTTQRAIADRVSASMIGDAARKLERATGWAVQPCMEPEKASNELCESLRAKGAR